MFLFYLLDSGKKAPLLMEVRVAGKVARVREEQLRKASSPMEVSPAGRLVAGGEGGAEGRRHCCDKPDKPK